MSDEDSGFRDIKTGKRMTVDEVQARFAEHDRRNEKQNRAFAWLMSFALIGFGYWLYQLPAIPTNQEALLQGNIFLGFVSILYAFQSIWWTQIVIGLFGIFSLIYWRPRAVEPARTASEKQGGED